MSYATHCIPWDESCAICNPTSGQESRAGGAAPQEPDFAKGREALGLLSSLWEQYDLPSLEIVRATLDQAEKEIARLREENAELIADRDAFKDRIEQRVSDMEERVGLRSSPPEETQRVTPEAAAVITEMVEAMRRYEMEVDEPPPFRHREMMVRAEALLAPSVSPSVPREEAP